MLGVLAIAGGAVSGRAGEDSGREDSWTEEQAGGNAGDVVAGLGGFVDGVVVNALLALPSVRLAVLAADSLAFVAVLGIASVVHGGGHPSVDCSASRGRSEVQSKGFCAFSALAAVCGLGLTGVWGVVEVEAVGALVASRTAAVVAFYVRSPSMLICLQEA